MAIEENKVCFDVVQTTISIANKQLGRMQVTHLSQNNGCSKCKILVDLFKV